jgi:hypothetical protein
VRELEQNHAALQEDFTDFLPELVDFLARQESQTPSLFMRF